MNKHKERGKNSSPNCNYVVHTTFLQKKKIITQWKCPSHIKKVTVDQYMIIIIGIYRIFSRKAKMMKFRNDSHSMGTWFIIIAFSTSFHEAPNWRKNITLHSQITYKPGLFMLTFVYFYFSCIGTKNTETLRAISKYTYLCPILANNCNSYKVYWYLLSLSYTLWKYQNIMLISF